MKEQGGLTAEERAELVAWMLGEADSESSERVQLALDQQPAWAAERARLEGVLGLLQEVRPAGGEAAPEALLVEARLAAGRRRGWRVLTRPAFVSAAASFALLLGLWATGQFDGRWETTAPIAVGERIAGLEEAPASAEAQGSDSQLTPEQLSRLVALGYYGGGTAGQPSERAAGSEVVSEGDFFLAQGQGAIRSDGVSVSTGEDRGESHSAESSLVESLDPVIVGGGDSDAGPASIGRPVAGVAPSGPTSSGAPTRSLPSGGPSTRGPVTGGPSTGGPVTGGPVRRGSTTQGPFIVRGETLVRPPNPHQREIPAAMPAPPVDELDHPELRAHVVDRIVAGRIWKHPAVAEAAAQIQKELEELTNRGAADVSFQQRLLRGMALLPEEWQALERAGEQGVEHDAIRAQAEALIRRSVLEDLLQRCRPAEGETADQYFLRSFGVRPFESTAKKPLATFAASVDTASYTHSRAYLERGELPPADLVRTEAFVNAFRREYADAPPQSGTFALHLELAPSPFGDAQRAPWLLRAAAVARHVAREERKPLALTFAVDVSGSMASANRLPLVQQSLEILLSQLDGHDQVAIVVYSNEAQLLLPMTPASNSHRILEVIRGLKSGGGTNLDGGVYLAFQQAAEHFDPALHNRVVLLSDGVGNIGGTTRTAILDRVKNERKKGIYLNTIGVGMGDQNDALLDDLARTGDGVASYVDNAAQARRAFVEDLVGTFETVARDVKLQMEFDPNQVGRYRLLGYESRALADRAFRDDSVDGGEVNAGHTVVALFELEDVRLGDGPLATMRLVHKPPFGAPGDERSVEQSMSISSGEALGSHRSASPAFRLSAAVAQAAEMLRGSYHRVGAKTSQLIPELRAAARDLLPFGAERAAEPNHLADRLEAQAVQLDRRVARAEGPARLEADLRFAHFELALERETPGQPDSQRLAELEARVAALEAELSERSR